METWRDLTGSVLYTDGDLTAKVFLAQHQDGRLEVRRVEIEQLPLSPESIRSVPIAQIRAWANGVQKDAIALILDMEGEIDTVMMTLTESEPWPGLEGRAPRARIAGAKEKRTKPDGFYERVAEVYVWLTGSGNRAPAQTIATANDVEVTTAHRWIKEARRRGLLVAGRKGKVG